MFEGSSGFDDGQQNVVAGAPPVGQTAVPEDYVMMVPEHIYVTGSARRQVRPESRPAMVVPSRITVDGGETTVASKAQPVEVLKERESLLFASDNNDNMNVNGIPDVLTANEFSPQEDFAQQANHSTPRQENPHHYSSQTSIAVETNPIHELKVLRRKLNRVSTRVADLELEMEARQMQEYLLWGMVGFSALTSIVALLCWVRGSRR